jgi:hypothetical protein
MNRERECGERESVPEPYLIQRRDTFTVRSLKSNFSWLKLFLEVKIRHATHWDRDACYSLLRIYLDATTKAGRHR